MDRIFLVEDCECNYSAFEDFTDAIKYAIDVIEKSDNTREDKIEMLAELTLSASKQDVQKWGQGFSIDEFLWCWAIDYKKNEEKSEPSYHPCVIIVEGRKGEPFWTTMAVFSNLKKAKGYIEDMENDGWEIRHGEWTVSH